MKGDKEVKDKILMFIIGALVGAVITTGIFYIYTKNNNNCSITDREMSGEMKERPDGEPPEKPSGEQGEPPAKPDEINNQDSN